MSEPTAVFAVGEFAEAVEDRRRSADRKSVVPALEFSSSFFLNYPKQEFIEESPVTIPADDPYTQNQYR